MTTAVGRVTRAYKKKSGDFCLSGFFFFFFGLYPKCNQNLVTGFKQGFPSGSVVKNTPVMQKLQVQSFGREDPLQKAMATHSSILSWESLWTEEPGRLQSMGSQKSDTTYRLNSNNILKPAFFKAYSGLESIKSKAREAIRRSLQCPDGPQSGPGWCREMMRDDGLRDVMETNGQKHGN